MKLGAALPHSGADASPDGMVAFAHRAEELGLDSLWVLERILRPVASACWTRSTPSPIFGASALATNVHRTWIRRSVLLGPRLPGWVGHGVAAVWRAGFRSAVPALSAVGERDSVPGCDRHTVAK